MSYNKKPFRKFKNKSKPLSTEQKIKNFVLRNSNNGYYTKVSTLSYKFEVSQDRSWEIVGDLLDEGVIESIHDERTGEMKICEVGKIYSIANMEQKRRREKTKQFNNSKRKDLKTKGIKPKNFQK